MKSKIFLSIFFILLCCINCILFSKKYPEDTKDTEYTLFIQSLRSCEENKVSYYVYMKDTHDKFILNIYSSEYANNKVDLNKYTNLNYGEVIKVKGKIKVPQKLNNPGEFNYKLYLYSNNIYGQINTYQEINVEEYKKNIIESIYSKIYSFKKHITTSIEKSMNKEHASIAKALIYGENTELEEGVKEDFKSLGISHLTSVSGSHITAFMCIINIILNTKRKSKSINLKRTIIIILIFFYVIFTGNSMSSLRAGIMLVVSIVCDMLKKKKNVYKLLVFSLIIILQINPFVIFNTGAILSYLAVLGIVMFKQEFEKIIIKFVNVKNKTIRNIITFIVQNIAITLSVQFLILPIQIHVFNGIYFPVVISNLLIGVISIPIRIIGMVGIMLSFIPIVSLKIFSIVEFFIFILLKFVNALKQFSFFIPLKTIPSIIIVIYYIGVFLLFLNFKLKSVMNISKRYNLKLVYNKLKYIIITIFVSLVILIVSINIYSIYYSSYVYFFNVEQGDMSYIKCGAESVIVDIGSLKQSLAFNTISNFFKSENIRGVNLIILSHMDKDHINGLEEFVKNYAVGKIIYSVPEEETNEYIQFKNIIKNHNINTKVVKSGDEVNLEHIKIKVLLPDNSYIQSKNSDNENSLVCKITAKNTSILYTGDAGVLAEEKLIKNNISKIDILKVGHHGSKSSTSNEFIEKISPQNAVISSSKKYYNHPHESVLETLRVNGVYTYITERVGAVRFNLK